MKIKDNSSKLKEECAEISGIVSKISDKTLSELEREGVFVFPNVVREANDITDEQMVLQSYNDTYRTSNIMGFLGLGEERLIIESRFSKGNEDYFFRFLLEKVMEFPNIINLEISGTQDKQLLNTLLFLFPRYLKAAVRKGLFKTYIRNEYNDENVNGTIDVSRHIRKNIPFTGRIAYTQREYSYDNYLIELIRHTIEYIKGKSYGNNLLKSVKDEVKLIVEASSTYRLADRYKVIENNKNNIVKHAYYHEYRDLQKLCILILQNENHRMGVGSKKVFGILFDGAWLWEEYVNTLIGKVFYHPMNKGGQGAQWLFAGKNGLIYPDFISRSVENRVIADAKYKPMGNIGNKDYLQMLAYMFRFEAKQGYFLYPETDDLSDKMLMLNRGSSFDGYVAPREDIRIFKHGFRIPNNVKSYDEFSSEMKKSEEHFYSCCIAQMQR